MLLNYRQEQGDRLPAGTPGRGNLGRFALTFVNPVGFQVGNYDVTTGDANDWSITVTNTTTGASITKTWTGAAAADDVALNFIAEWNADPNALVFGRASQPTATEFDLNYATADTYTLAVTPGGIGAGTATQGANSGFNAGFGHWAVRTLTASVTSTELGRTLISPANAVLEAIAGVVIRPHGVENPPRGGSQADGFWPPGSDVPCERRGTIWVPVTEAVKPGDPVFAVTAGTDAGKTATTAGGDVDLSSIANFLSVAAAGQTAEIEVTLA